MSPNECGCVDVADVVANARTNRSSGHIMTDVAPVVGQEVQPPISAALTVQVPKMLFSFLFPPLRKRGHESLDLQTSSAYHWLGKPKIDSITRNFMSCLAMLRLNA